MATEKKCVCKLIKCLKHWFCFYTKRRVFDEGGVIGGGGGGEWESWCYVCEVAVLCDTTHSPLFL